MAQTLALRSPRPPALSLPIGLLLAVVGLGSCGIPLQDDSDGGTTGGRTDAGTGGGVVTGLPCDVATVLSTYCTSCHGATPSGGAPVSLASYSDLTAISAQHPGQTLAQRSLLRMQDAASPMPPGATVSVPAAQISVLSTWLSGGSTMGACTTGGGNDPLNAAATCTSAKTAPRREAQTMNPGQACIACHATTRGEAPTFSAAGTVFPTGHEPDECIGQTAAIVVLTGANGQTVRLTTNSSGNFLYTGALSLPYTAKVQYMGRERLMVAAQTSGDCNSCHTQSGANGAPGRVTQP